VTNMSLCFFIEKKIIIRRIKAGISTISCYFLTTF
jgi:hypothetical protein